MNDFHLHTKFSDGKDTPERMILTAIDMGLTEIGISEHGFEPFDSCCFPMGGKDYLTEMRRLAREYKDKINVLCGVEADYYSEVDFAQFDYVIASVHYIKIANEVYPIDLSLSNIQKCVNDAFKGDVFNFCDYYYKMVAELGEKIPAHIIGHVDIITKFCDKGFIIDTKNERYVSAYEQAVDELLKKKVAFEINTGAMSRGYRSLPYPEKSILEYIFNRGGKVILSSDAHKCQDINNYFDVATDIAKSIGFKEFGFTDAHGVYHCQK